MCELCDPRGREFAASKAERYERMAAVYRQVARGNLKPHTEEFAKHRSLAIAILNDVVEWA